MEKSSKAITGIVQKYDSSRENLLSILQETVRRKNYLTKEDLVEVARQLNISAAEVYGTASFYSFLDTEKRGKYVIRVCRSIISEIKGKKEIIKTLEDLLKIKVGETTADGMFSLLETNDIGWGDQEPSMLVNEKPYTNLTSNKIIKIINDYKMHQ
jgi:NADH-quinone oxidoreductase subunit E